MTSFRTHWIVSIVAVVAFARIVAAGATTANIDIDLDKPGPAIPPTLYGLMTEEINHSYDGGLYAELVQNRTFQDNANTPIHWSVVGNGKISMDSADPVNPALPISLRLDLAGGEGGAANDGFWGIPVKPDTQYVATFYAKAGGGFSGPVTAAIVTDDGKTIAKAETAPITTTWQKYTLTLSSSHDAVTTAHSKFVISASGTGSVLLSSVSLFPPTYEDVPNGLRSDLMKLMADMHPAFIRLPGGNYLEGDTIATRFDWKKQIGPSDQRPGHMGCWSYRSSDGFGLPQYLLWCKQLHAEPVLALFAGYSLRHEHIEPGPELQKYVDDALDEIEYVSGPADSTWGKRRADDGFTEPFPLHYVEVGNEDWFDPSHSYDGRFAQFFDAIRAKYPQLKVIATTPVRSRKPDLVDDHFYRSPSQMAFDWDHYDKALRDGPQIFVGEWASQEGRPTPDLNAALADAAWLMGLERNADLIPIECYAPLLVNVNAADRDKGYPRAWQWGTNLIGYDALTAFGSPSYYVQAMFGQNKGDLVLPTKLTIPSVAPTTEPTPHGAIGVGTWHTQVEYKDITITAPDGHVLATPDLSSGSKDWQFVGPKWNVHDGSIEPSVADDNSWAFAGDPAWTDYTLHLKARKTGGDEGFLILYHVVDGDNYHWWNVGGWGNSANQLEIGQGGGRMQFGSRSKFQVQTGQWYDLRIEVSGHHARCFIDDKLVNEGTDPRQHFGPPFFASASYITATQEAIVKVVNFGGDALDATLNLRGAGSVGATGKAILLSGDPQALNTVEQPTHVAPQETEAKFGASFQRTFPPHSLTLLRFAAAPAK